MISHTTRYERLWLSCRAWLASWLLRGLFMTLRPVYVHKQFEHRVSEDGKPFLLAFWHGRMLYFIRLYSHSSFTVLVSQSRDGEFISRILQRFGIHATRGSTNRQGMRGVLQMVKKLRQGYRGALTPDGPRGPRYQAHPGIVAIAKKTGSPILPVTYNAQRKHVLESWDGFIIPLPFSRVVVAYGEPIYVPSDASASMFRAKREEVEASLQRITAMADNYFKSK